MLFIISYFTNCLPDRVKGALNQTLERFFYDGNSQSREMAKNKTFIQFFEWYIPADGGHWKRFADAVPGLLEHGISAAWLPPAYKGTRGNQSEGYDVYD